MKSSYEKIDSNRVKVDITLSESDWKRVAEIVFSSYAAEIQVPGFRPGKAPRSAIERLIGPKALFDAVREEVVNDCLISALKELELQPISKPDVDLGCIGDLQQIPTDEDVNFSVSFEVWPEISQYVYKGMKVSVQKRSITEEEIDNAQKNILRRMAKRSEKTDTPIENGDFTTFRFRGEVSPDLDTAVEGALKEPFVIEDTYTLYIGDDESIPGLTENILGLKKGEEKDFEITLGDTFPKEEVRGRKMQCHVAIHRIEAVELPELTEQFLTENLGIASPEELRTRLRESFENTNSELRRKDAVQALDEFFVNTVPLTLPTSLLENRKDIILDNMRSYYKRVNQDLDLLLRDKEKAAEIHQRIAEEAENQVRVEMVYDDISHKETIEVTPEEVKNFIYMMQNVNRLKDKDVKRLIKDEDFILSIRNDLKNKKVVDFLLANNEIIEVAEGEEIAKRVETPEIEPVEVVEPVVVSEEIDPEPLEEPLSPGPGGE